MSTKANRKTITTSEMLAALTAMVVNGANVTAWLRSVKPNRKPNEAKRDFGKRFRAAIAAALLESGENVTKFIDPKSMEGDDPTPLLVTNSNDKEVATLYRLMYRIIKDLYAPKKADDTDEQPEEKGWGAGDADIVAELTKVFKAKGITTKAAAIGFLSGLAAS